MSAQACEALLARLYADAPFRERFLESPEAVLDACDLTPAERIDLRAIDVPGLLMASHSYARKRSRRPG